ncbi:MAG: potassium channel protein [Lewinellaceae bacterium]|nr:potassium channel protein [Phaeodactylibacter sp.]MCB0613490.1 potassium channel protein [Phaeodactylibacter sp.]MCB9347019.1 potassium channel protein [Lewinellaceae bacterium]
MQRPKVNWNIYTVPSSFLSIRVAIALALTEFLIGVGGYMAIEGYGLINALYMTVITISTVGFSEIQPLSPLGRIFTSVLITANIGIFAYVLAAFSYYVIQGEIFKNMHLNLINSSIDKLENHIILCGFGRYGREIALHFEKHKLPFVVLDLDPARIEQLQKSEEKTLYLEEDATHDEALIKAGIKRARALISALPDDSDNVFVVLTARQISPKLNIISRAKDPRSQKKLFMAGADHVVMPEQIGGFYMATLVSKPGAVEFFSFITSEYRSDIGFEEVTFDHLPPECRGRSLSQLNIRESTGANIIGYKAPDGHYEVNPAPTTVLGPGSSYIVLGSDQQLKQLRYYLEHYPEKIM